MRFSNLISRVNFIIKKLFLKRREVILKKNVLLPISTAIEISDSSILEIFDNVVFRKRCSINVRENAKLSIGKNVFFNDNCIVTCRKRIMIGEGVIFGPNVVMFDHDHDLKSKNLRADFVSDEIIIEDGVWIGANTIILKGTHIGRNSIIGAASVVKGNVPSNSILVQKREDSLIEL